jgi:hypothetical protein
MKVNQTLSWKFPILEEGVYYTYFVYEVMNSQNEPNSDPNNTHGRSLKIHDHVLDNESHTHYMNKPILQDPYQNGYKNEKHVVVRGTIAYKNTRGYLSADVKNFKGWSLLFVFIYGALAIYWINTIVKNQNSIIVL